MIEIKGRQILGRYIYGKPIINNSSEDSGGTSLIKKGAYKADTWSIKFFNSDNIKVAEIQSGNVDNKIVSIDFEEVSTGCGAMKIVTSNILDFVEKLQRVDINLFGDEIPWWSGYILTIPTSGCTNTKFTYLGHGYYNVLDKIMLFETYENKTVTEIVIDIAKKLESNYNVVYNSSKIENVTYTITKIKFDGATAKDALQDLADFAVGFVFGIDYNRNLYFHARDEDVNEEARLWVGNHLATFEASEDVDNIVNWVKVKNASTSDDDNWIATVEDTNSQDEYGICQDTWTLPSSYDASDATTWANNQMIETAQPTYSATAKTVKLEYKNADGSFNARKMSTTGQAAIYKLDGKMKTYPISTLKYTISSSKGICLSTMTLGSKSFELDNYLAKIERSIKVADWLAAAEES